MKFNIGDEVYVVASGVALRACTIIKIDERVYHRFLTDWGYWYSSNELELQTTFDSPLYKALS